MSTQKSIAGFAGHHLRHSTKTDARRGSIAGFAGRHLRRLAKNRLHIMASKWLENLKQEENKHNTAAALRERQNRHPVGPAEKPKTPINPPSKTSKTTTHEEKRRAFEESVRIATIKTSKTTEPVKPPSEAEQLGLVATWSVEFGYVSLHDPTSGEWHDLPTKEAPSWAVSEARKRKELYRDGNRKAYRLTSQEIGKILEAERPVEEEGIVEDHPVEEEEGRD